jgi:hypothetical protein
MNRGIRFLKSVGCRKGQQGMRVFRVSSTGRCVLFKEAGLLPSDSI